MHQHQHLHEAAVGGEALDLLQRLLRRVHGQHDGGAQSVIPVEPFGPDPVVQGAGEGGRTCPR